MRIPSYEQNKWPYVILTSDEFQEILANKIINILHRTRNIDEAISVLEHVKKIFIEMDALENKRD
jgi:DNA-binding protein